MNIESDVFEFNNSILDLFCLNSAKAWAIYDSRQFSLMAGVNVEEQRQVASLSKIMTCLVVCQIIEEKRINPQDYLTVSEEAANVKGTSAKLQPFDELRIIDLLYGLMLPSGNDAAVALGEHFGSLVGERKGLKTFLKLMNYFAKKLNLDNTYFHNPHGLTANQNYSSARDISALASYSMSYPLVRKIVRTKEYEVTIFNQETGLRSQIWQNTNKIINNEIDGIKTGTTKGAGKCLCVRVNKHYIITVLGCDQDYHRWVDTKILAKTLYLFNEDL